MPALIISRLEDALDGVRVVYCDLWGVVHNGVAAFPDAVAALRRARARGVPVILLSNAPRPASTVFPQLERLGAPRDAFDAIVTSGDVTIPRIKALSGQAFHHIGPERDRPLFDGLGLESVAADSAGYLLCTGLFDDTRETPDDYRASFAGFIARALPMLCANPDLVVDRGGKEIYCAGALAELYRELGGEAEVLGKPHPEIYALAAQTAGSLLGAMPTPSEILMIGDSFRTDIAGANRAGLRSIFTAGGIHAPEMMQEGRLDQTLLGKALKARSELPDFVMPRLA